MVGVSACLGALCHKFLSLLSDKTHARCNSLLEFSIRVPLHAETLPRGRHNRRQDELASYEKYSADAERTRDLAAILEQGIDILV